MTNQAQTRLLLALWDLGGAKQEVKKGDLTKRIVAKGKKVADFKDIFAELEKKGAIAISKKGYSLESPQGLEVLSQGLKSADFKFEGTIVGTWAANALVRWIGEMDGAVVSTSAPTNGIKSGIKSYDELKSEILDLFEKLDGTNSYSGLVPIWHLRPRVKRTSDPENFNKWMMAMQAISCLSPKVAKLVEH
jgi:hypothetical protein